MNKSSKKKLNYPITYYKYVSIDGQGTDTFETAVTVFCYRMDEIKRVLNLEGIEEISNTQLYFDGDDITVQTMSTSDKFAFDSKTHIVKNFGSFYKSRTAALDLLIVYL